MGLIWGVPYLFIKIAVGELTPATLVFFRSLIGALLLLPLAVARKDLAPLRPYWKWILAYTFVEVAAPWFLLSDAERRISSSLTGLLIAAVPSIGAALAVVTGGHDRLDSRRIVGLILGFIGVAALVGLDVRADDLGAIGQVALVALGLGVVLLHEPFTVGIAIGFVLIVLGSVLATRRASTPSTHVSVAGERGRPIRSPE